MAKSSSGKIFGGIAGFLLGGPVGAIMGVLAGKWFDDNMMVEENGERYYNPEFVFWIGISVLAAKISKADGRVQEEEIAVFQSFLNQKGIDNKTRQTCGEVFNNAKTSSVGYESYARDIYEIWHHDNNVLAELLVMLFRISMADGKFHPNEEQMLKGVAREFGFSAYDYERLFAHIKPESSARDYEILGIHKSATDTEIKKAYRELVKEFHPDRLASKGLPKSAIDDAKNRVSEINTAYERIMKTRKQ